MTAHGRRARERTDDMTTKNEYATLENQLLALLAGQHTSLAIEFNYHASDYCTVAEAIDRDMYDPEDWVSDTEREASIRLERVWSVQWYPNTPVGFCLVRASTLEAAINAALSTAKGPTT